MTRVEKRDELKRRGERVKKDLKAIADKLDPRGRLDLKLALQETGDISESVARLVINGDYGSLPRQEALQHMEGIAARFRKAKAS